MEKYSGIVTTAYGYCQYICEDDDPPAIYNLYVWKNFRGKHHARELLQLAIDHIRNFDKDSEIVIEAIPTENSIDVEILKKFYTSMGLRVL